MNTVFIRLEGPLQSWGTRARWTERDSGLEPSKSGVIGIVACCLGWNRQQDRAIRELSRAVQLGVRVDRQGRLVEDYHTVEGGVLSAEGKIKITQSTKEPEAVVSHRQYLADASFLVALWSEDETRIQDVAAALQSPVWPPFLGRRSCPPTIPLFAGTGTFNSTEDALGSQALPVHLTDPDDGRRRRAVLETRPGQGTARNDEIDRLSLRTFTPRYTREVLLEAL